MLAANENKYPSPQPPPTPPRRNQKGGTTWQIYSGRTELPGENSTSNDPRASPASLPVWHGKIAAVWQLGRKTRTHTDTGTQVWEHTGFSISTHKPSPSTLPNIVSFTQIANTLRDASHTYLEIKMWHIVCPMPDNCLDLDKILMHELMCLRLLWKDFAWHIISADEVSGIGGASLFVPHNKWHWERKLFQPL